MKQSSEELLSPKVDFVFKVLFGDIRNKALLIGLLNAVLQRPPGLEIVDIEILNPLLLKDWSLQKDAVLDILAKDSQGNILHIEMQCELHPMFIERLLYYWARLYGNQLAVAESYKKLCPVISIAFVNDVVYPELPQGHHCWQWRTEEGMLLTEHGQIHIVELPKFTGRSGKKEQALARWVKFLREGDTMTAQAIQRLGDPNIEQAYAELERISQDPNMRVYYEERLKGLKDYASGLEHKFVEGKIEGKIEGKAELIQHMYQNGVSISQIVQMTGTTESQIQEWLAQSSTRPSQNIAEPTSGTAQSETTSPKKKVRSVKKR